MKKWVLLCAAIAIGFGAYFTRAFILGRDSKHDFDLICAKITEIEQRSPNQDPILRAQELADFASSQVGSPEVIRILNEIAVANTADKYRLMVLGAKELGYAGWSCPALQRMWAR